MPTGGASSAPTKRKRSDDESETGASKRHVPEAVSGGPGTGMAGEDHAEPLPKELYIAFEVWSPVGPFKMTNPGPPGFSCIVATCDSPLPDPRGVLQLRKTLPRPTDLRVAAVDATNTVMFFSVKDNVVGNVSSAVV